MLYLISVLFVSSCSLFTSSEKNIELKGQPQVIEEISNANVRNQDSIKSPDVIDSKEYEEVDSHSNNTASANEGRVESPHLTSLEKENSASLDSQKENIDIPSSETVVEEVEEDEMEDISEIEVEKETPPKEIITQEEEVEVEQEEVKSSDDLWIELLSTHVSSAGFVDYQGFKKDERKLITYLEHLKSSVPSTTSKSDEAKAYWMNAYNAFTIYLILKNYPLQSIRDIDNGNPWDTKWIQLGGQTFSLNNIEHDIIRKNWADARIHFAVNCAAKSCPPLSNRAFKSATLDKQLEDLTRQFVNKAKFNRISTDRVEVSKIFEWYAEDFGDLIQYLDKYTDVKLSSKTKVTFREYDWALNGK